MNRLFAALLALVALAACVQAASIQPQMQLEEDERIFRMTPGPLMAHFQDMDEDDVQLQFVRKALGSLDILGVTEQQEVDFRGAATYGQLFTALGFNVTDITALKQQEHEELWASQPICDLGAEACADQDDAFYDQYQTLESIHARLDNMVRAFPSLVSLHSWGRTYENRDQKGVWVTGTGGEAPENKPVVFWFCGEHAREWIPPMFCTYMAETLATQYLTNSRVKSVMDRFRFAILPVMNADGYVYSQTQNSMWRKSRKPNAGSGCVGTDLNRNWPFKWASGGSSRDPCSDVFHGSVAMDNVETNNLFKFSEKYRPFLAMDCHAYGGMWMHAWGWSHDYPNDNPALQKCGDAARDGIRSVNGLNFATGTIARVIYVASGSSVDTFYGQHGVTYAYAAEVRGNSFQPPVSNIKLSNAELWEGMLRNLECAATTL